MGISERKTRDKEDVKKRILEGAKELFVEKGFEATSMRNIAERVEFSPTTLYLYYKDKNDIVFALHQEGFKILSAQLRILESIDHPYERLKAIGRIYIRFAQEFPDFYELMFVMKAPIEHVRLHADTGNWVEGTRVYQTLYDTVNNCQNNGYFNSLGLHHVSLMIWSTLHGICMLNLHHHLDCIGSEHTDLSDSKNSNAQDILQTFFVFLEGKA